jgi:ABC-type nickel/cobalt efflux system permease component RcnA
LTEHIFYLFSALALGALHALEPGHGKTLIAAYMIGNKGTIRDAVKLGTIVTFTHTIGVVLLGLLLIFFSSYFLKGAFEQCAQIISALIVLFVGMVLVIRSYFSYKSKSHESHNHHHDHHHHHRHRHHHRHHNHDHHHEDKQGTNKGLIWLGISGGLVPCHGALAVLMGTFATGGSAKMIWGLLMVIFFSFGLGLVVMVLAFVAAKFSDLGWLRKLGISEQIETKIMRQIPVFTAVIILGMGIYMTANSFGLFGNTAVEHSEDLKLL